jgi:hypothetical protein
MLFVLDYPAPIWKSRNRPQASDVVEFSSRSGTAQISAAVFAGKYKPGPKGPDPDLIRAVVKMKQRNPTWACPRIADQINLAFETSINKDVVRRILALQYRPAPNSKGPSWLTFLGHMKDSRWSIDLMRCESILLRTHWVLVPHGMFPFCFRAIYNRAHFQITTDGVKR